MTDTTEPTSRITPPATGTRAIVIGASMAGLLAARAMSDTVGEVIIIERDECPTDPEPRRGVPQGRHAHALLAAGERVISNWFPGIIDELVADGAMNNHVGLGLWWQDGGFKLMGEFGGTGTSMSRPLLEGTVRKHVLETPNAALRSGSSVHNLSWTNGAVDGVVVDGAHIPADIVIDCSGRNSRLVKELEIEGYPEVPVSNIQIGVSYGSKILRRRDGDLPLDATFSVVAPTPPREDRSAVLLPIEGDRWILTLAGMHGDSVPVEDDDFLEFARSLPTPVIADLLDSTESLTSVMSYRYPSSQRRHFEKVRRHPVGYIALGDAICSFNPIYGQGMSSSALQATRLAAAVNRHGLRGRGLARTFYADASKVVDNPWQIAAGADFLHPSTKGAKAPGTDLVNRYVHHVQQATHVSQPVLERMIEVQSLLRPATSLMHPFFMLRVLAASRRARRIDASMPVNIDTTVDAAPELGMLISR